MKILVLNYEYPPIGGGGASVSRDIAVHLVELGHEVVVVTMKYGDLPEYVDENGVQVYRLKCIRKSMGSCTPFEQFTYLIAVRKFMKKYSEQFKFDICHTHFIVPTGEVARYIKKKYGIEYVITAHGSDVEGHNKKIGNRIMHIFLRPFWKDIVNNAKNIIVPSDYLKDLLQSSYPIKNKYIVVSNGVNIDVFKTLRQKNKENMILTMCRLQKSKNMQTVIRAFSKNSTKEWKLVIMGDGPYRRELEKMVSTYGIEARVIFTGWVRNMSEKHLSYLAKAHLYVTASHFESFSLSVVEAVASGIFPLVSDIPAHRQLLQDDKCFFMADDYIGLAEKIERFINGRTERELPDIEQYNWNRIVRVYENILMKHSNDKDDICCE